MAGFVLLCDSARVVVNLSPPPRSTLPYQGEPAGRVGPAATGEHEPAGHQRVIAPQRAHAHVLVAERLERFAIAPEATAQTRFYLVTAYHRAAAGHERGAVGVRGDVACQIRTIPGVGGRLKLASQLGLLGRGKARPRNQSGEKWRRGRWRRVLRG